MNIKPIPYALLLLTLLAAPAKAEPTWVTTWQQQVSHRPGTMGDSLKMARESADVDVKSIVKSKGVTYFRWRYFIASKDNIMCRVDPRICEGIGAAVKCSSRQFLRDGQWVFMAKSTASEPFIAAARFACDF